MEEVLKKLITAILSFAMILAFSASIFAAEINKDEKRILEKISGEPYTSYMDIQYVNMLENYFSSDDVNIKKENADKFLKYLLKALKAHKELKDKGRTFDRASKSYQLFQHAGASIDLYLEYDSRVNDFYAVDKSGYIVCDSQKIIKDTGEDKVGKAPQRSFNISIEIIFAFVILLCLLGVLINFRKWINKIRKHSDKNYDDEEEDEMELANRKTRRARLQTFSYKNFKQVLMYFYVPIIMIAIVVAVGFIFYRPYRPLLHSIKDGFVQTLSINSNSVKTKDFNDTKVIKDKTIDGKNVSWPKYSDNYGLLINKKLKMNVPLFMGDSDYILSGKPELKLENDFYDEFDENVKEEFKGGAGTYIGSSIPGNGKPILVGGHDTTFFAPLEKVKKGMEFAVITSYACYKYKVKDIKVFDQDELDDAYDLGAKKETLILYTCYPFGKLKGDKSKRLFVYLDKTYGPSISKEVIKWQ